GPLGANGDGAKLSFKTTTGTIFIDGNLSVSGTGVGNGGAVTIQSGGLGTFDIASGATGQGINGFIDASAGAGGGNGGTISITAGGVGGGIQLDEGGGIFCEGVAGPGHCQGLPWCSHACS